MRGYVVTQTAYVYSGEQQNAVRPTVMYLDEGWTLSSFQQCRLRDCFGQPKVLEHQEVSRIVTKISKPQMATSCVPCPHRNRLYCGWVGVPTIVCQSQCGVTVKGVIHSGLLQDEARTNRSEIGPCVRRHQALADSSTSNQRGLSSISHRTSPHCKEALSPRQIVCKSAI